MIEGLEWAKALPGRPKCIPQGRARGAKAAGLRYEREIAGALPGSVHGQWFEFRDRNGLGYCQPDLLLRGGPGELVVLEAKYTWVAQGHGQIAELYRPVVELATKRWVLGIVVCKVLRSSMPGVAIASTLEEALNLARQGRTVALHWIGQGELKWAS